MAHRNARPRVTAPRLDGAGEHPVTTWRLRTGTVQADLAKRVRISQSYLSRIETWQQQPSLTLSLRLSAITGVPVSEFPRTQMLRKAS